MLKNKITITGTMTTQSGLSIGGTKDDIGISTQDNPIIKNPLTGQPYIPGSSIKGKMRSLFELSGLAKGNNFPCGCGNEKCIVCRLFGAHMNMRSGAGSPRLIFRDAYLSPEFEGSPNIIELKTETAINRITGTASGKTLRNKERIAAGVAFNYEICILIYDGDNADELLSYVENGLRMIESTGLGSKVSAGYGKVSFHIGEETYKVTKEKFMER